MNISQAAEACGLPVKTLRYYETLGLVTPGRQSSNDYREYSSENIEHLRFLQQARAAGFSLEDCRRLMLLYFTGEGEDSSCPGWLANCIDNLDLQLDSLAKMRQILSGMLAKRQQTGVTLAKAELQGGMSFMLLDPRE